MRLSEIQQRRNLPPESQPIPIRRAVVWVVVALGIAIGIFLYFRFAGDLTAVLSSGTVDHAR